MVGATEAPAVLVRATAGHFGVPVGSLHNFIHMLFLHVFTADAERIGRRPILVIIIVLSQHPAKVSCVVVGPVRREVAQLLFANAHVSKPFLPNAESCIRSFQIRCELRRIVVAAARVEKFVDWESRLLLELVGLLGGRSVESRSVAVLE